MYVNFNILNQLGSPSINSNTFANRPAAGQTGRLFVSTDTFEIYRDNGTTWDLIGGPGAGTITGSGTATQVAYFTGAQTIGSSANLFWDNTNTRLGIGTNIPTNTLSVTGTAYVTGDITGNRLIKIGGLSTEYLMADGSTSTLTNPVTGTGTATQVAYFTGAQTIGSSANLFWDNTNTRLGIGTATPGSRLDIHGTGTLQSNNSTGATNNNYLQFQRAGANVWRIGDTYNGGTNFYSIFNSGLSTNAALFYAATNKGEFTATETIAAGLAIGTQFTYNLTVPNATTFGTPNAITALGMFTNMTLQGNSTVPIGTRQGLDASQRISFTTAGTMTVTQGGTVRAFSNISTAWSFAGTQVGTVTHLAGIRIVFPDNIGSAINVNNNYGILINDQTTGLGTVTYTNRWGIYQEGASDLNYFNGNLLIKSTTNSGEALQVNGSAKATNVIISEQSAPATPAASTGILYAKTDNLPYYKNDLGTEYSLTAPENLTNVIFRQLGSQFIGYPVANPSLFITTNGILGNQTAIFVAYYLQFDQTITGVKFFQAVQGVYTANNYNGVGLYTFNAGTMTLVASSTNDGNIWKGTANTWQTKAFSSTYVATAGIYFVALLYNSSAATTDPQIGSTAATSTAVQSYDFSNSVKLNSIIAGQTALPATQLQSGTTGFTRNVTLLLY